MIVKKINAKLLFIVLLLNLSHIYAQPKITLHAENSRLSTVLSILAEESGYNIVTGPNVSKEDMISIHLDDVDIEQAINLIIRASGLGYEIVGNSILVADAKKLKADVGITSQVYDLQYANAQEVLELLTNINTGIYSKADNYKIYPLVNKYKDLFKHNNQLETYKIYSFAIFFHVLLLNMKL